MAESTAAFFLQVPPDFGLGTAGAIAAPQALSPEGPPSILWGRGTPNGDLPPFNSVNKGSLYMAVDQTDDSGLSLWSKVDEGGDNSDWVAVLLDSQALLTLADFTAAAAIQAKQQVAVWGPLVDVSAADSEAVVFHAVAATEIAEIGLLWEEATDSSGVEVGDVTIGTATGGAQIVAATAYAVSQASGDYQALTIAEGTLAAGDSVFVSHDQIAEAGTYRVVAKFYEV